MDAFFKSPCLHGVDDIELNKNNDDGTALLDGIGKARGRQHTA